ncbi:NADH-quinone oxidoreductase subunit C/D [Thalassoglobus neptunius]|uniref:NADH-quinone oxidoreductase subunit C n=1 Tax=Thalassoglobus neptunius TaxID=1938619 RepID=A0A5C5WGQ1_9PLAN|nr:NADH-quinone oxidoreductase subunit C [Thalassoglobus neptunius]TWT49966.1 NADH-quinone oxidoreductase subunit C/D [Thalassoglobus neptunius]
MTPQEIHQSLIDRFGEEVILGFESSAKDPWIEVAAQHIAEVGQFVKSDPSLKLDMLCDLSGVDYLEPNEKQAKKFPFDPHLEVVYHLLSIEHNHKITLKVKLPRWKDDQAGQLPSVPSVSGVWAIADWHEREAYDLVGIFFEGHPNLVRILCPDDWEGHPLRKDYEFPLEYHGIRG